MASSISPIQEEARFKFTSPFPFFLKNGGLCASLDCTSTSARTLFVGKGQTMLFFVIGADIIHVAWGESDVVSTLNHLPIFPAIPGTLYTLDATDELDKLTHIAGITAAGGGSRLLIGRGDGV